MIKVSPSILACDFSNLRASLDEVKDYAEYIHIDVMDGVFVNNISIGIPVVKSLRPHYNNIFDVHLMIVNPLKYIKAFSDAGADIITFHYETGLVSETIAEIKKYNKRVGLSIKPNTPIEVLDEYLDEIDLILVMSVEPGFGGQSFLPNAIDKVNYLHNVKERYNYRYEIEVDGGINDITGKLVKNAGANVLVAGSYIFSAKNKEEVIKKLKE